MKELDRTEPLTNSKKEHLEMDGWLKRKRHCLQTAHNLMMTEKGKLITV